MFGLEEYSKEIAEQIREVLTEDSRDFHFNDGIGFFEFTLDLESKDIDHLQCIISVGLDSYTLFAIPPLKADTRNRRMMVPLSKFLHLANYRLYNGCFQLNYKTGEIRYKIYHDCQSALPSKITILESILTAAVAMGSYAHGLTGLIFQRDMTAEEAFEDGERKRMRAIFVNNKAQEKLAEPRASEGDEEGDNGFDAEAFLNDLKNAIAEEAANSSNNTESEGTFNMNLFDE